jgi:hypothetical protein
MSADFWSRQLGGQPQHQAPPAQPAQPRQPQRAWWQDPEPEPQYQPPQQYAPAPQGYGQQQVGALQQQMPYGGSTGGAGLPEGQYIAQLKRVPSSELTGEQMEHIADYEIRTMGQHTTRAGQTGSHCPRCDSGNFATAGTRNAHGTFTTDKCFDCNFSARGPEPGIGGGSKKGSKPTRQIDSGGGVSSMYLRFNGLPNQYVPRV